MKLLKIISLTLLTAAPLIPLKSYAEDCSQIGDYVHCLFSTAPDSPQKKWQRFEVDGQKIGPVCAPLNTFSYIPQKNGKKSLGNHIWILEQCDNQACAHPLHVITDSFTVMEDPQHPNLYTSQPKDTSYQANPNYGDDCTQATPAGELFKSK